MVDLEIYVTVPLYLRDQYEDTEAKMVQRIGTVFKKKKGVQIYY